MFLILKRELRREEASSEDTRIKESCRLPKQLLDSELPRMGTAD
jgi:hypothetical protein